jgi:hypothetical protein
LTFGGLLTNALANIGKDNVICFDPDKTLNNNSFNPRTGKFVCPSSGEYTFTVTVTLKWSTKADQKLSITVELVVGNEVKGSLAVESDEFYTTKSTTIDTYVGVGETVYIRRTGGDYELKDIQLIIFSGRGRLPAK